MTKCGLTLLLVAGVLLGTPGGASARKVPLTPSGWRVTPVGSELTIPRNVAGFQGPLGAALSPGGAKLLTVSSGVARNNSTDLWNLVKHRQVGSVKYDARKGEAVFYGVAFSRSGRVAYASGGGQNVVHVYHVGSRLREVGQIPVPNFPAGMAYGRTPRGSRLYVVNNLGGPAEATNPPGRTVTVIDPATSAVTGTIDLGVAHQPLAVTFDRTDRKAYVTNWIGRSVSVIDTATETVIRQIALSPPASPLVADHPSAIAANPRRDEVYTANANSDTVSVINTRNDRLAATIDVSLVRGAREGATPNGLVASADGRKLYVALGGENAVAVIDVARRRTIGFIPTSWYPTDVELTPHGRLVVLSANATGRRPNLCNGPYAVGDCSQGDLAYTAKRRLPSTKGAINLAQPPSDRRGLAHLTRVVKRNNRVTARGAPMPGYLVAIRHVIYVIKENRTYDQVLGALGRGRGDETLALFREDSAPNHHALARRFTLIDNFYADAEVSADGHSWIAGAGVTDYTNKMWPITYSPTPRRAHRARDFEHITAADRFLTEPIPLDAGVFRGAAAPTRGYLWDNAYEHGVSFRNYGEFTKVPGDCRGAGNTSGVTHLDDTVFGDNVDERFPGFNMLCSDHRDRFPEWQREFDAYVRAVQADPSFDPLPALQFVRLPNDHTFGTTAGRAIPEAYMADNDLAMGKLVEAVSHSPFWASTAIFVTEDDAQNGPDHIDAHRTLAYVISPHTQRRASDHTHYDTASMVATIEDLLHLPPMTIADQRATRMWAAFTPTPDPTPYDALQPEVIPWGAPGAQLNSQAAPLARQSARWDFQVEDATPEIPLNRAIWKSIRGAGSEMPAPRHDLIVGQRPVDVGG